MNSDNCTFTYQTRLQLDQDANDLLDGYAKLMSRIERALFAEIMAGNEANRLKSSYLTRFAITARQFNACSVQVEGKIDSIKELREMQIKDLSSTICDLEKKITQLQRKKRNAYLVHQKKRRLQNFKFRLQKLIDDKQSNRVPLCFGSKKLFRAQFNLAVNGYSSHDEWFEDWNDSRNNSFFVLGSKDETSGNQTCSATIQEDGSITLRLRLPDAMKEESKYLILPNITFAYGHQNILDALYSNLERNQLLKKKDHTYKDYGKPISYRFKRDKKGWILYVSTPVTKPECMTKEGIGAIGVDINSDHLAVVETDRFGNPFKDKIIPLDLYGKSTDQALGCIGDAVKKIIDWCVESKKPIVIEKLDFQKKKSELKEKEYHKFARILSSFSYASIISFIKSRAFRLGVKVEEVNPAYTSVIGLVKFSFRYGLSRHESAALCIARRYQGVSERLPRHLDKIPDGKGGHVALSVPVRNRDKHVWSLWRAIKKRLSAVLAAHFRAIKNRSSNQRKFVCCDMVTISDTVGEIPTREPLTVLLG